MVSTHISAPPLSRCMTAKGTSACTLMYCLSWGLPGTVPGARHLPSCCCQLTQGFWSTSRCSWGEGDGGKQDRVGMVSPLESAAACSPGELWTQSCTAELSLFKTRRLTFLIPVSVNHQLVGCLAPGIVQGSGVISLLRLQ